MDLSSRWDLAHYHAYAPRDTLRSSLLRALCQRSVISRSVFTRAGCTGHFTVVYWLAGLHCAWQALSGVVPVLGDHTLSRVSGWRSGGGENGYFTVVHTPGRLSFISFHRSGGFRTIAVFQIMSTIYRWICITQLVDFLLPCFLANQFEIGVAVFSLRVPPLLDLWTVSASTSAMYQYCPHRIEPIDCNDTMTDRSLKIALGFLG